jgi:hypothetical protein
MKAIGIFFLIPITFFTFFCSDQIYAIEIDGINFPDTANIHSTTCLLNGAGIRKKLIIDIYAGALYLSKPITSADDVIKSDQVKRVQLNFVYKEVRANQLTDAWNEGFKKNNTPQTLTALKDKIDKFNGFFTEPIKKFESMSFSYIPGTGTEVEIKGNVKGVIEGKDFMEALFSIWFGPNPPDKKLKEGMLGKKK